ncbi:DUF3253 domain-containing protein [Roseospira goensis]|uniref:DUF3253 domain-containing protein n=1 Tax=Roseospira goensis TaxID=391922 RepID=A0A7W6S1A2_9PROT|nr:DUF3253 domain-containing protein [Roseospira goensis]MBB4287048.1 hypothetical protein [Roseospira goensis]
MSSATDPESPDPIAAAILDHVAARGPGKTLCPSEVAKALAGGPDGGPTGDWRPLMKPVRATAIALARAGRIGIYRKGKPVADPGAVKGVIRLGTAPE